MVGKICYMFYKIPKTSLTQLEKLFLFLLVITGCMLLTINSFENVLSNFSSKSKIFYVMQSNCSKQKYVESNSENSRDNPKYNSSVFGIDMKSSQAKQNIQEIENPKITNVKENAFDLKQNVTKLQTNANHTKPEDRKSINYSDVQVSEAKKEFHPESQAENTNSCLPVPKFQIPKVDLQECSGHHVIIHDGGQLGNKMCQYISLYLLRHLFGIRVSITEKMKTTLDFFFKGISLPVQDFKCFIRNTKRIMYEPLYKMLHTKALAHIKGENKIANHNLLNESYYIFHHPCPREVITDYRDLVRDALKFKDDILEKAKRNIQKALRYINRSWQNSTLVTVHVRRRDYTQYIMKHYNLTQLNEVYFQRAFNYFRESAKNPVFVVVSDDHGWCRKVLETRDVVVAGSKKNPVIDIAVLSLGDHHIISYGTFSFMGAILGHGTIIHPVNNNKLYNHYDCVDSNIFQPISRDANAK